MGPEHHASTLATGNNLGSLHKSQDKLDEAEMMFQRDMLVTSPEFTITKGKEGETSSAPEQLWAFE